MEEQTHCTTAGGGYTIVYDKVSVEDITGGKYRAAMKRKAGAVTASAAL